jgi:hypothetical protein
MKPVAAPIAYKMKMSREVADHIRNRDIVALKLPLIFPPGTRLFLQEYVGAPTGRADVTTVIGTDGDKLLLARRWCWARGKEDDDLSGLGLALEKDEWPLITAKAIP